MKHLLTALLLTSCTAADWDDSQMTHDSERKARVYLGTREAELRCYAHYCDVLPPEPAAPYVLFCGGETCRLAEAP